METTALPRSGGRINIRQPTASPRSPSASKFAVGLDCVMLCSDLNVEGHDLVTGRLMRRQAGISLSLAGQTMTAEPTTQLIKAGGASAEQAARVLAAGGLVAFPTETVYGLGADATNGTAVARLYQSKGRPAFNPLIAHVPDIAAARALARFDRAAERLAAAFWPGPLTLVLPKRADCPVAELATAGLDTVAVRVPNHPVARALLMACGHPVAAPSANRSGHLSPTTAQHVLADLRGRIELIVDGGPTPVGLESTIVACLDRP